MQDSEKTLIILDGYSFLHRHFQNFHEMRANPHVKDSIPTGVIYNTIIGMNNISSLIHSNRYPFTGKTLHHVCVYDFKGPSFRDEWMPDLTKKNRQLPEAIRLQIGPIEKLCAILGWKTLKIPGLKCIDVIGTLTKIAITNADTNVVVISGNQDLFQLADDRVTIFDGISRYTRDANGVARDFGLPPSLMLDYQVMNSSGADGKRNISKMTPASAVRLLKQYGSLQGVIDNSKNIPHPTGENVFKVREVLATVRESLLISTDCDLAHIDTHLPSLDKFILSAVDKTELRNFYSEYGFTRLLEIFDKDEARLSAKNSGIKAPPRKTSERVAAILNKLRETQLKTCSSSSVSDYCVYRIRNIKSTNVYFGSTNNPLRRWTEHLRDLDFGIHVNEKLRKDWDEHGFDSFEFKIIRRCSSAEEMHDREQLLIDLFWGRANCCNREATVETGTTSRRKVVIVAEHEDYQRLRSAKTQEAITKIKGWGAYLSVHAVAKDLGLPKVKVKAALNTPGQSVDGWFFGTM